MKKSKQNFPIVTQALNRDMRPSLRNPLIEIEYECADLIVPPWRLVQEYVDQIGPWKLRGREPIHLDLRKAAWLNSGKTITSIIDT